MSTLVTTPNGEIKEIDIFNLLPPDEGEIAIYYGRIGNGKTLAGSRNIMADLRRGLVVYANWPVNYTGFNETASRWRLFLGLLGVKRNFYYFPRSNFHYWSLADETIDGKPYRQYFNCQNQVFTNEKGEAREMSFSDALARLTDCCIHLDEGHIPFDSYEANRMSEAKRTAVFAMRHYDRKLTVYTQRANSVHVNLRGNANRFYKCEKTMDMRIGRKRYLRRFLVTEFQDLKTDGSVDEALEIDDEGNEILYRYQKAVSQHKYWGRKKYYKLFNSKYLRGSDAHSQPNNAQLIPMTYLQKLEHMLGIEQTLLFDTPPLPPKKVEQEQIN